MLFFFIALWLLVYALFTSLVSRPSTTTSSISGRSSRPSTRASRSSGRTPYSSGKTLRTSGKPPRRTTNGGFLEILVTMGPLIFFLGLRSAGSDTAAYISSFKELPSGWSALFSPSTYEGVQEWLFRALGVFCKTVSDDYHLYLFVIALISGLLVAVTMRRYSERLYPWVMLLFLLGGTYSWMFNGIRQFLAVSILFAATPLLVERRTVAYILVAIVASFIHSSAIMMVIIPFLVQGQAWNKRTIATLAVAIFAILATSRFIGVVTDLTGYSTDAEITSSDDGSSFLRTILYAVPLVLAYVKRKEIEEQGTPFINLCINMTFLCVVLSLVANVTYGIYFGRLPIYFSLYGLILLVWLVGRTQVEKRRLLVFGLAMIYIALFLRQGNTYYYSDLLFDGAVIDAFSLM